MYNSTPSLVKFTKKHYKYKVARSLNFFKIVQHKPPG